MTASNTQRRLQANGERNSLESFCVEMIWAIVLIGLEHFGIQSVNDLWIERSGLLIQEAKEALGMISVDCVDERFSSK